MAWAVSGHGAWMVGCKGIPPYEAGAGWLVARNHAGWHTLEESRLQESRAMARDDVLEPIRTRAYFLWEQAGRPEGGDLEFWDEARRQVEAEQEQAASLGGAT